MSGPVKKNATYADLVDLPENVVGEIIAGNLYASPRPRVRHAAAHGEVLSQVQARFRHGEGGPGGWWILPEPELHFGEDTLVPDLAGWRMTRLPTLDPEAPYLTLAPDWVCEITSPSTARLDRVAKLPVYAREGVAHAWLVDPAIRLLEVLRLENGRWTITAQHVDDERARIEPFAEAELDLARWWL